MGAVRVAAVGDVHAGADQESIERLGGGFDGLAEHADLLLLAGDLTRCGTPGEVRVVADAVARAGVPAAAVLGNHDHHAGCPDEVVDVLESAGVAVVEGTAVTVEVAGCQVSIAGAKGFGGGFAGASVTEFGEAETKAFARHGAEVAERLAAAMTTGDGADLRLVLLHYSPVRDTLRGESPELYPFLGSYLLAEAIDDVGADLVVHGHAHHGSERGMTPAGLRVRNVAQPVIRSAYRVFELQPDGHGAVGAATAAGARGS
jgi:Icc-related predicted phosphoesterase